MGVMRRKDGTTRRCGDGKRRNTYGPEQKIWYFLQAEAAAAKARATMTVVHFMLINLDFGFGLWVEGRMYLKD